MKDNNIEIIMSYLESINNLNCNDLINNYWRYPDKILEDKQQKKFVLKFNRLLFRYKKKYAYKIISCEAEKESLRSRYGVNMRAAQGNLSNVYLLIFFKENLEDNRKSLITCTFTVINDKINDVFQPVERFPDE